MRKSLLPPGPPNLFQGIKSKIAEAEKAGIKVTSFAIGQPAGPAYVEARIGAAQAVLSDQETMHEYQDNGSPGVPGFAERFVKCHVRTQLTIPENMAVCPIPGIKPILDYVVKSLGSWTAHGRSSVVGTMTAPGYPTPADACAMIRGVEHFDIKVDPENGFLFDPQDIGFEDNLGEGDMLMLNFPHNPTGIIATRNFLRKVCSYCQQRGVRLFNDGAYLRLSHTPESTALADVAIEFPELNWMEAYSASKAGNNTGSRIGAVVGSPEFVSDFKQVKGKMDSGFVASMAAGVIELFERYPHRIDEVQQVYQRRLEALINILEAQGMRLAVQPEAGFFALFKLPQEAFGTTLSDAAEFNDLMIQRTGFVGVPFGQYIRYSVAARDVEALAENITSAFRQAQVRY